MAFTIETYAVEDTMLSAGEHTTFNLVFSEPVKGLEPDDFVIMGITFGTFETTDGGKTWAIEVIPVPDYNGPAIIELKANEYSSAVDGSPGEGEQLFLNVDTTGPRIILSIDSVTDDNIINIVESSQPEIIISGKAVGGFSKGDVVTLSVNGTQYTGEVDSSGQYNIAVASADLVASTVIDASIVSADMAGNVETFTATHNHQVDLEAPVMPSVAFESTGDDDVYNDNELGADGTVEAIITVPQGTTIGDTLTINGSDFVITQEIINEGVSMQVAPATQIIASITDTAGNQSSVLDKNAPEYDATTPDATNTTLNIDDITADNTVNLAESTALVTVTGSVAGIFSAGDEVTLTINGTKYFGNVDAAGKFAMDVAGSDLAADGDFKVAANILATADNGNQGYIDTLKSYNVDLEATSAPTVSFEDAGADGVYNDEELGTDGTVTATITVPAGAQVGDSLTVNGTEYTVTQDIIDNGVTIDVAPEGEVVAVVTDQANNPSDEVVAVAPAADTTAPDANTTQLVIDDITSDNIINQAEANSTVTITGSVSGEFQAGDGVTVSVNGSNHNGTVDANGRFSIDVDGSDLATDADNVIEAVIAATDAAGNVGIIEADKAYGVDTVAPDSNTTSIVINDITADNTIDDDEVTDIIAVTGQVTGEYTAGDQVNLTVNGIVYSGVVAANGDFSIDVAGSDLAGDDDHTIEASATVTDAAGNAGTVEAVKQYDISLTAEPIFLSHLGYDLTQTDGPYNECGKAGSEINYLSTTINDQVYIGYEGFDTDGNLIESCNDGDFERDCGDPDGVWVMNTGAGDDLVQLREDQNAYTVAKLGTGDDTYYIGGTLDADLHTAQTDADARAYVLAEEGNDTIVVGGNGEGKVTGWGIDGGRIFTGAGNDEVVVYGEVDDGAVIDLGSGNMTYANGYDEAKSADGADAVNSLVITHNLGDAARYDYGIVQGTIGRDNVSIGTCIKGVSQVILGDNDDTLSAKDVTGHSYIDMGTGDDSVEITGSTWGHSQFLLGTGTDKMSVKYDLNNSTRISTDAGEDLLIVGEDMEDCSLVEMGEGNDTLKVGKNIENHAKVATDEGNDTIYVNGNITDSAVVTTDAGNDVVMVNGVVNGHAQIYLGSGNNYIEVANGIHGAAVISAADRQGSYESFGIGNDILQSGEDIDGCAIVNLGDGNNVITVAEDVEDRAQLITGYDDDLIIVDRYIEDCSTVSTGSGDDVVNAEGLNNSAHIDMGVGNDVLTIGSQFGVGAGSAHVTMGEGDDVVTYGGAGMDGIIEGEAGFDTLIMTYDMDDCLTTSCVNITNLTSSNFTGFEQIELQGNNVVDIRYSDIVNDTDRDGALFIKGDESSKVDLGANNWNSDDASQANLTDGCWDAWSASGSTIIDGVVYDIYHHTYAGSDVSNDVFIQQGITVI